MVDSKKFELLTGLVEEFGLSFGDVVSFWTKKGKFKPYELADSTKDTTSTTSQVKFLGYRAPQGVSPGMYVYTDGLIYPEIVKGRQVKAVVGYVKDSEVLAVCLDEANMQWQGFSGEGYIAAKWCRNYAKHGIKQGEAFLPSVRQLKGLADFCKAINASLTALGAATLSTEDYWSSDGSPVSLDPSAYSVNLQSKTHKLVIIDTIRSVRPVITINL